MNKTTNVVSLQDWKEARPKEATLSFQDGGQLIVIRSPDQKTLYMREFYENGPSEGEFDALVNHFKDSHPQCVCIDF